MPRPSADRLVGLVASPCFEALLAAAAEAAAAAAEPVPSVVAEAEAVAAQAQEAAAEEAVAEVSAVVDEVAVAPETVIETPTDAEATVSVAADATVTEATEEQDEDKILEALINEEEQTQQTGDQAQVAAETGFSVEDLESFTLGDTQLLDNEDDEEEDEDADREMAPDEVDLVPSLSVVMPDAGKIRFAEDIVEESRGAGRGNRKGGRRGGAARRR